jgi:hypothetical protein
MEPTMPRPRTWTDDDLVEAIATASTMADVVRTLRLRRGGAAYVTVRTRMEQLGLELPVVAPSTDARPRTGWTDEDLRSAVAHAESLRGVFVRLGLAVGGSQWLVLRARILDLGLETRHWARPLVPGGRTVEPGTFRDHVASVDLRAIVVPGQSRAALIRRLGYQPTSTTYRHLRTALAAQGVPDTLFAPAHASIAGHTRSPRPLDELLVEESPFTNTTELKRRLVENGWLPYRCDECGIDEWRGHRIGLHLDHVNGIRNDRRLVNLRLLCPNCHSQTETYAGRNKGRYGPRHRA